MSFRSTIHWRAILATIGLVILLGAGCSSSIASKSALTSEGVETVDTDATESTRAGVDVSITANPQTGEVSVVTNEPKKTPPKPACSLEGAFVAESTSGTCCEGLEPKAADHAATVCMKKGTVRQGSYGDYTPAQLALANEGKVVLFFKANWCPTCRAVDADITSHLSDIPDSVAILKVDYDTSTELKRQYGVTYQHTFVQVDAAGRALNKWSGSGTLGELVTHIK